MESSFLRMLCVSFLQCLVIGMQPTGDTEDGTASGTIPNFKDYLESEIDNNNIFLDAGSEDLQTKLALNERTFSGPETRRYSYASKDSNLANNLNRKQNTFRDLNNHENYLIGAVQRRNPVIQKLSLLKLLLQNVKTLPGRQQKVTKSDNLSKSSDKNIFQNNKRSRKHKNSKSRRTRVNYLGDSIKRARGRSRDRHKTRCPRRYRNWCFNGGTCYRVKRMKVISCDCPAHTKGERCEQYDPGYLLRSLSDITDMTL